MSRHALVVGINSYTHLQPLTVPIRNASAIAQRLEKDQNFQSVHPLPAATIAGFDHLSQEAVLQAQLQQALQQLFRPEQDSVPDTALFYFSGYVMADPDNFDHGFLITSDADPSVPRSGLSLRWLRWLLSESPVKQQLIWLDCCNADDQSVQFVGAHPGYRTGGDRCFIASSQGLDSFQPKANSNSDSSHTSNSTHPSNPSSLTQTLLEGLDPRRHHSRWITSMDLVAHVNQTWKTARRSSGSRFGTHFGHSINLIRTWHVESYRSDRLRSHSANQTQNPSSYSAQVSQTSSYPYTCPYKGLEYFDLNADDPHHFFGRDTLVDQLLDRVLTSNFTALVGPAGSGKSSVLRAGLLHQIQLGQRISGSDQWRIHLIRPDRHPLRSLARAFVDATGSELEQAEQLEQAERLIRLGAEGLHQLVEADVAPKVIVAIDAFDEFFTQCHNSEERQQVLDSLLGALSMPETKLCLVLALNSDFMSACLERDYSSLADCLQQGMVSVLPLSAADLKEAICQPAQQAGVAIEAALVSQLLHDATTVPNPLPLLQHTLKQLWHHRQGGRLRLSTYQDWGGMQSILGNQGDDQVTEGGDRPNIPELAISPPWQRLQNWVAPRRPQHLSPSKPSAVQQRGRRRSALDVASWVLLPLALTMGLVEYQMRENRVQQDYARLTQESQGETKQAVEALVSGCRVQAKIPVLPQYVGDRLFGSCRPLAQAQLAEADLSGASLNSADLIAASLRSASLHAADLSQASLVSASLSSASLRSADLRYADLSSASLHHADLHSAYLTHADLSNVDLQSANLQRADLREANLVSATLREANLHDADLEEANFIGADFEASDLSSANLAFTNLSEADLRSTSLRSASLRSAYLSYANLSGADLAEADLRGAILLATNLSDVLNLDAQQLQGASQPLLCNVTLPDHLVNASINPNRDCGIIAQRLSDRYEWISPASAQRIVAEARQRTWHEIWQ